MERFWRTSEGWGSIVPRLVVWRDLIPTDPVELSVVEQPLPVEEHTVLTAPAAEAGGRWSSIWLSGMNLFRTRKGYASKALQTVKDGVPPPITRRAVSFVKGAWECAIVHTSIVVVGLTTIPEVSPWLGMAGLCITWLRTPIIGRRMAPITR